MDSDLNDITTGLDTVSHFWKSQYWLTIKLLKRAKALVFI